MCVFWRQGFEATSLDDLTAAMGISRSSFYATFGNKQKLFVRALTQYSRNGLDGLRDIASGAAVDPVSDLMAALADPQGGSRGCLLINCITELAPHDPEVADIGRRHLQGIEDIFARAISPENPDQQRDRASAFASLAIGTLALRKAGIPPERIAATLRQARTVIAGEPT